MSKVLEIGEYTLEDGVTLERTGKFVTVRPIEGYEKPRCYECKHCGSGRATRCGYTTPICLLQPKGIIDKDGKELYYHIGARRLACEKFEKKGE
jgi:hypothetical protein